MKCVVCGLRDVSHEGRACSLCRSKTPRRHRRNQEREQFERRGFWLVSRNHPCPWMERS